MPESMAVRMILMLSFLSFCRADVMTAQTDERHFFFWYFPVVGSACHRAWFLLRPVEIGHRFCS